MKKIGLYIPHLSNGGAERVVSRLSVILGDSYEVYVILNEDNMKYEVFCKIINLNVPSNSSVIKKICLPLRRARKLRKIKKMYQLHCVISFLNSANIVNVLSKTKYTSTIVSVRNFSVLESKVKDFFIRLLYKRVDYVVPVSLALKNRLIENYGIPSQKIKTIYNPYNVEKIEALSKANIDNIEHQYFLNTGKIFVTVGRLTYQKGHWHLLKAFSMIPDDREAKLLIIGNGENQPKIEQLIKDLKLEEKVLMVGYQKNPFQYISRCYGYVLSSLFEGFPNALIEAMACQCPVIAADCKSGPREILFHDIDLLKEIKQIEYADYGIIVPGLAMEEKWKSEQIYESEKFLAEAMIRLLDNESLRNSLSEKGHTRVKTFNYQVCKERYIKVIENGR